MHFDLIRSLIADQFMIDADTITMDTNLVDDLGADSLDVVDLIMSVEEELNVSIQDENISNLRTVRDIVSFLDKLTGEQED
jgi:acyl carrier protein